MKNLIEQFPDATKKPERKKARDYDEEVLEKIIMDDIRFTKLFWKEMKYIALGVLVAAVLIIWMFYAIIYGQAIDEYLTPIK